MPLFNNSDKTKIKYFFHILEFRASYIAQSVHLIAGNLTLVDDNHTNCSNKLSKAYISSISN